MAVDLATSGSLGYGLGLQAKVPDKSGLALQLENQRLKRKALEAQAEDEKAKRAAKQEELFQKAINVDKTKWHKTLVGKVNIYANEAINEYDKLFEQNPKLAQNSINQIVRKFNDNVNKLHSTNKQRWEFDKSIGTRQAQGIDISQDDLDLARYLSLGSDDALTTPFESSTGQWVVNPDSTIVNTPIPKSTIEEDTKAAANNPNFYTPNYRKTATGIEEYAEYTPENIKAYMDSRYGVSGGDSLKKSEDVNKIVKDLKATFDSNPSLSQLYPNFNQFIKASQTSGTPAAQIVDGKLFLLNAGLLAKNAPTGKIVDMKPSQEVIDLAQSLYPKKWDAVKGEYIVSTEQVDPKKIQETWEAYKGSNRGKLNIDLLEGEKKAKTIYENAVKEYRQGMRQLYQGGVGEKAKEYTWKINVAPTGLKVLNASLADELRTEEEKRTKLGDYKSASEIAKEFEGSQPKKQWNITGTGMTEVSYNTVPPDLKTKQSWLTGAKIYPGITGSFRSILKDSSGSPKYIIVDEINDAGDLTNTWAIPYDLNKSQIVNSEEIEVKEKKTETPKKSVAPKKTSGLTGGSVR